MTVLEVINAAADYLAKHGVDSPRLNAEHLLAHTLKTSRLELYLQFDRQLDDTERAPLRETIRRRAEGAPLQHLLGQWDFFGRSFQVDSRALIPRPETEQLVELVLKTDLPPQPYIADIGTGSGVIAITLALELPDARITATDLSTDALSLAQTNAELLRMTQNIVFQHCDLLPEKSTFDAIVANLPYVPSSTISTLSREVQHDPHQALDGGNDGLTLIRRLISQAPQHLNPHGYLFLEFGIDQETEIETLLTTQGFINIHLHTDHQGICRFATARMP